MPQHGRARKKDMHACLQVEPGPVPGQLDVWALIDTAMHKMTVEVPRKIYVDVAADCAQQLSGARRVDRTLPDGSQPANLLELELPEEELLNEAQVRPPPAGVHASLRRSSTVPGMQCASERAVEETVAERSA